MSTQLGSLLRLLTLRPPSTGVVEGSLPPLSGMGAAQERSSSLPLIDENVPVNHDWVAVQTTSAKRWAAAGAGLRRAESQ